VRLDAPRAKQERAFVWKDDTFKEAGKVGVWTKADSTTLFDDFAFGADINLSGADQLERSPEERRKG